MKFSSLIILAVFSLVGCTAGTPESLSQKLKDKTGNDRAEVLRLACLNEAEWSTKEKKKKSYHPIRTHVPNTHETSKLKALCREMNEAPSPKELAALAQKCGAEIQKNLKAGSGARAQHAERMKLICEEMTGQKISLPAK